MRADGCAADVISVWASYRDLDDASAGNTSMCSGVDVNMLPVRSRTRRFFSFLFRGLCLKMNVGIWEGFRGLG